MSFHPPAQMQERANADSPISHGFLQRKCDSGDQHTIADGEYTDLHSSGQLFNPISIGMFAASCFGHDFSQVKLHAAEASQTLPSRRTPLTVQRFPKNEDEMTAPCPTCSEAESTEASAAAETAPEEAAPAPETEHAPTPVTPEPMVEAPTPEETPAPGLIVEDSTTELGPGQMRKSEFLAQLRMEVCRTVETAIAETGRTTDGCPYIGRWFDFYSRQDSAHIERAIRRYAPEASNATTARGYISAVTQRARQATETWARTGEITGVPEGIPIRLPGIGLLGGLVSGIGSIFFKARNGGARMAGNPRAIQARLGSGQPLDSGVRSRMESAFGMDFSHVRTHTDSTAAGLSDGLNARAFTVGEHVAFGSGEYKPGTLIGDALIAHEMAHVVQQGGGNTSVAPMQTEDASHNALEEDADKSTMGAVASLCSGIKGMLKNINQNAMPCLMSGLRLQRCARRTRPVSRTEADELIRGHYGSNLQQAIAEGTSVAGADIRVEGVDEFRDAYLQKNPGSGDHWKNVDAWVDHDTSPPTIWIRRDRQHPGTLVHEGFHLYSNQDYRQKFRGSANEGITEYFTRKILDRVKIEPHTDYKLDYEEAKELVGVSGEDALRQAYFEGNIEGLCQAVDSARGRGTLDNWWCHMLFRARERARSCMQGSCHPCSALRLTTERRCQ